MAVVIWRLSPRSSAVAVGLGGLGRDRVDGAGAGELGVGGEALGAGDLADQLAGVSGAKPGSASRCGAAEATSSAICASSGSTVWDSSRKWQIVARVLQSPLPLATDRSRGENSSSWAVQAI